MDKILESLNDRQKEAVTAIDGKIRIVAGAGSGKTKALTHRYAYLVEEIGIDPANILCLTFTNKAAQEMKTRIAKMVHVGNFNDFVSTIHGFCVKVLRKEIYRLGYPKSFTILDEEDEKLLASEVMRDLNIDRTVVTAKQFIDNIRLQKKIPPNYIDEYLVPKQFQKGEYDDSKESEFKYFLAKQQKAFALGFEDLINFTIYIFETFEDSRSYWQNQFDYVMVDEVQDCNINDWSIINMITTVNNNLFIVGDPDQAIYEWRGARPNLFVNFHSNKDIILNENYRSTQNILNVANSVIANNETRIKKDLFTNKSGQTQVIHYHGKSEIEEGEWICKQIENLIKEKNASLSDFAILYRASYLSRNIEQELMKEHLDYVIYGGIRFFERKEIKDALSYLRLIDIGDDLSFLRVVNTPSRKIGDAYKAKLKALAEKENTSFYEAMRNHVNEPGLNKDSAIKFVSLIEEERAKILTMSISDLLHDILKKSGLEESLRTDGDEERLENLAELQQSIVYYESLNAENDFTLNSYLQDIALYTNMDYNEEKKGSIKLMTIHQSKGLEFPYVFVYGLTEGVMPSHRTIRDRKIQGLEEERRLMYVAVTRAEKALFLTESEGYNYVTKSGKFPSRFLAEIKKELFVTEGNMDNDLWKATNDLISNLEEELETPNQEFSEGDEVYHKFLGKGVIESYNEEKRSYLVKYDNGTRNIRHNFLSADNNFE